MAMAAPWGTRTITPMTTDDGLPGLLTLTQWLSPAFPLGAFAYSHGLEHAISVGAVRDRASLCDWLRAVVAEGSGRSDAVLLSMTRAGADPRETDDLARALAASPERLQESLEQGRAFLRVTNALLGSDHQDLTLPVAVGLQTRQLDVPASRVIALYLQSFVGNLVQGAVRLIPLGQTDGQQVVADLAPSIASLSDALAVAGPSDLGTAAIGADLAAMAHEHQEVRLFRS